MSSFIVFDTETTGLDGNAEIVEIAILDDKGDALINTLVKPKRPIPDEATAIHGISNEMVADAPTWASIFSEVEYILNNNWCKAYNAPFDMRMLLQNGWFGRVPSISCVMADYIDKYNINLPHYPLSKAAMDLNITFDGLTPHRAASDCAVTIDLINKMCRAPLVATGAFARQYKTKRP